ncbi:hypothetical protein A28LD_2232 [Idiomarina sp. A28L]|uniref:tetratricopeptide repeat protein n=1 Tax=Idiomarina sp. A28L TaxID=1036674 RepID=UPI0002138CFA|nr:hypothetical protein [Idiomarina sp. A28L]EGN74434.1 hypothetical protein A28LD_2232 [Idiomarina sp. A28L]
MKTITTIVCAVVVAMGFTLASANAQQNTDVGFTIPTADELQRAKDNRRSQALAERVARRVMAAYELYEAEDIRGAIAELEEAPSRTDYDRAYVARFMGSMLASLEDDPTANRRAIAQLEASVAPDLLSHADHAASLQLLGNLNLIEENFAEAIDVLRRYLQFTGEWNPDVLIRMASAHMELKQYDRVIPLAEKALENMDEPHRNPYVLMIAANYEAGKTLETISVLERGVVALPSERAWWVQLGMMYNLSEQYEEALATMRIAYDAGYFRTSNDYRALVQLYANNSVPFYAAEIMSRHLEANDIEGTARNYATAARAYNTAREFAKSAESYGKAVAQAEDNNDRIDYNRRQGEALLLAQEYRRAAAPFRAAIELSPSGQDTGRLYMSLAEAYFYSNQYRQAYDAAQRATRFSSTRRNAEGWSQFIKDTASRRGVDI